MSASESRPKSPDPAHTIRDIGDPSFVTANEAVAGDGGSPDALVFDPRNSFYPQTLLTAADLRAPGYRPPTWMQRNGRKLAGAAAFLVLGVAAIVFLVPMIGGQAPAASGAAADSKASATGAITPSSTPGAAPATASPAKPANPAPTVTSPAPPASPPVSTAPAPTLPAPATAAPSARTESPAARAAARNAVVLPPVSAAPAAPALRSGVTHLKGNVPGAAAPAAPAAAAPAVTPAPSASTPPTDPRVGPCTEALAALGLCTPAK